MVVRANLLNSKLLLVWRLRCKTPTFIQYVANACIFSWYKYFFFILSWVFFLLLLLFRFLSPFFPWLLLLLLCIKFYCRLVCSWVTCLFLSVSICKSERKKKLQKNWADFYRKAIFILCYQYLLKCITCVWDSLRKNERNERDGLRQKWMVLDYIIYELV